MHKSPIFSVSNVLVHGVYMYIYAYMYMYMGVTYCMAGNLHGVLIFVIFVVDLAVTTHTVYLHVHTLPLAPVPLAFSAFGGRFMPKETLFGRTFSW